MKGTWPLGPLTAKRGRKRRRRSRNHLPLHVSKFAVKIQNNTLWCSRTSFEIDVLQNQNLVVRQNSDRLWNQQHSCCRLHQCSVISVRYVLFPWTLLRNTGSPLSLTLQSSSRESGTSSTACRAQKASSTPKVGFVRQALLAAGSPMLVRLETSTFSRHARNCGPLASRRIQLVLEGDFEGSQDLQRSNGTNLLTARRSCSF